MLVKNQSFGQKIIENNLEIIKVGSFSIFRKKPRRCTNCKTSAYTKIRTVTAGY